MLLSQQASAIRRRVQMVACAALRQQVLGPAVVNLATVGTIAQVSTKLRSFFTLCNLTVRFNRHLHCFVHFQRRL